MIIAGEIVTIAGAFVAHAGEIIRIAGKIVADADAILINAGEIVIHAGENVTHAEENIIYVEYYDAGDSVKISVYKFETATGIEKINLENKVSVYPNPASSVITIHESTPSCNQMLLIINILGEEIYNQPVSNSYKLTIDISQWCNGVYFYQIIPNQSGDKGSLHGKFLKQ